MCRVEGAEDVASAESKREVIEGEGDDDAQTCPQSASHPSPQSVSVGGQTATSEKTGPSALSAR